MTTPTPTPPDLDGVEAGLTETQRKANIFADALMIATAESEGEFVTGDDGFVVYWPERCNGAFNARTLRLFADELDRRNAAWETEIEAHFATRAIRKEAP